MIPPLVTLLLSSERSTGNPLTRREVEEILSRSTAVMMAPRDVVALERARGYADTEPELAWEQWEIVRNGMWRLP